MKKFLSKVLTGAMVVMLVSATGIQVKANNYADRYETATLDDYNGISTYYTVGRSKEDYSSGYVKNIRSSYSGETRFSLVASDGNGSKAHYENFRLFTYAVKPGESTLLTNYVKECGYNYAAVKVEPGSQFYMQTYFAWSPDNYAGK